MTRPHFLIIGAMKSGSTSLFRWLGAHPKVRLPQVKEPAFFSVDANWRRGPNWYQELFPALASDEITGEASVHYTDPVVSERAARRVKAMLPDVRLIFIGRDPVERLRSHYRHEVQRGREHATLVDALSAPNQPYVRCSQYNEALAPWLDFFPREALLTLRFEDVVSDSPRAWLDTLSFLQLSPIERPLEAHNVTSSKQRYSPLMRVLYDHGVARIEKRIPRWLKRSLAPLLLRNDKNYERLLRSAKDPIPTDIVQRLHASATAFELAVGWGAPARVGQRQSHQESRTEPTGA